MNHTPLTLPDNQRSRLRRLLATIDREISHLSKQLNADAGSRPTDVLVTAFAALVDLLALGTEPELRQCPICNHIGMRAATRCGYCWTKLAPLTEHDERNEIER